MLINLDTYEPVSFCLYQGPLPQDVEEAAPYLVYLEKGSPFTNWVLENGWGNHWGIFAISREKPKAMRRHFRSLVMIKNSQGKRFFFRYYDPRVLHPYLTTCNENELKRVFGPVIHFITEHDNSDTLLRFSRTDSKELEVTSSRLDDKGEWDKPHPRQKIIIPEESFNNLKYETYTLVARDEQLKVLLQRKRQAFIRRLAEHLETNHSQLLCEKNLKMKA